MKVARAAPKGGAVAMMAATDMGESFSGAEEDELCPKAPENMTCFRNVVFTVEWRARRKRRTSSVLLPECWIAAKPAGHESTWSSG